MELPTIGFIGGGRITRIVLQALANKRIDLPSVQVCDTSQEVLEDLRQRFPDIRTNASCEAAAAQEVVVIALHPPAIMETLEKIKASVSGKAQVLSFAPKIGIGQMAALLPTPNISRMIPNATSCINEGFNPVAFSKEYAPGKKHALLEWLRSMGETFEVDEPKLEGYAMLSAMLPTYFWFQWKELQDLGHQMGLDERESRKTVEHTLMAAIKLFYGSGLNYREIIDLIPVRPIGEHEEQIREIYRTNLTGLYQKIKPV